MEDLQLFNVLNHLIKLYTEVRTDQSQEIHEQLTLSQYKVLASCDVQTMTELHQGVESYLSDHLEILKLKLETRKKQCSLAEKLQKMKVKFDAAAEDTRNRNAKMKSGEVGFLNPKPQETVFAKPEKPKFAKAEPVYSTRPIREEVALPPAPLDLNSMMKPPTFSSIAMSTKKERKENIPRKQADSFNLDDSLINGHEISMVNISEGCRRLNFDEDEDKTPAKSRENNSKTPSRNTNTTGRKPLDVYSLPPPPVFTSRTGSVFNQTRD